jgi:hypothetical protein
LIPSEFAARLQQYRQRRVAANRWLTIGTVGFILGVLPLARWMESHWGSRASWPYALVTLIVAVGGLLWYMRHVRRLARETGVACGKCGVPLGEADRAMGKCRMCGAMLPGERR